MAGLEAALASLPAIGAPDYSDEGMLQYLRAERIVPPYQTRGYKLVELVRIYEAGGQARPMRVSFLRCCAPLSTSTAKRWSCMSATSRTSSGLRARSIWRNGRSVWMRSGHRFAAPAGRRAHALQEFGAAQHEIVSPPGFPASISTSSPPAAATMCGWRSGAGKSVWRTASPKCPSSPPPSGSRLLRRSAAAPRQETSGGRPRRRSLPPPGRRPSLRQTRCRSRWRRSCRRWSRRCPLRHRHRRISSGRRRPNRGSPIAVAPAVVLPLSRSSARSDTASAAGGRALPTLDRLLRMRRGARRVDAVSVVGRAALDSRRRRGADARGRAVARSRTTSSRCC